MQRVQRLAGKGTIRLACGTLARWACAGLLVSVSVVSAAADDTDAPRDGDGAALGSLARSLVGWIEETTGYDVKPVVAAPPDIVFVSPGDRIELPDESVSIRFGMAGLYSPRVDAVFLVLPWSLRDEHDQGVLLHQLVRAVLHANGTDACTDRLETEAYALVVRWFAERGITPMIEPPAFGTSPTCTTSVIRL